MSRFFRGGRVLPGDQQAVFYHVGSPVFFFGVQAALLFQLIFQQEGHHAGQLYRFFLSVGEAGNPLPFTSGSPFASLALSNTAGA